MKTDLYIDGYVRLKQIIGDRENPGIIPISRSSFLQGVKDGRFPKPVKLGPRTTAWKISDIRNLIERGAAQ